MNSSTLWRCDSSFGVLWGSESRLPHLWELLGSSYLSQPTRFGKKILRVCSNFLHFSFCKAEFQSGPRVEISIALASVDEINHTVLEHLQIPQWHERVCLFLPSVLHSAHSSFCCAGSPTMLALWTMLANNVHALFGLFCVVLWYTCVMCVKKRTTHRKNSPVFACLCKNFDAFFQAWQRR